MVELSVVISTHNRRELLRDCLERFRGQTADPSTFEVVVVIGGSTDGAEGMLRELETRFPLRVMSPANAGPGRARNAGIEAARGEFCLFINDDIRADPELIAVHLNVQRDHGGAVVLGPIRTIVPDGADWFARASADYLNAVARRLGDPSAVPTWTDLDGGNFSVPRAIVEEVGGFGPSEPGAVVDLAYRLERAGKRFVFAREAVAKRVGLGSMTEFLGEFEAAGEARAALRARSPETGALLLQDFHRLGGKTSWIISRLLQADVPPHRVGRLVAGLPESARRKWFALLKNHAYWRGVREGLGGGEALRLAVRGTPILMYHAFGGSGEPASRYVVPGETFERQMDHLRRNRYRVLALGELIAHLREGRTPPDRSVVLTIDDGFADNYDIAYPVLRRFGYPATIFLVTGRVGGVNDWDADSVLTGRPLVTWSQVREMVANGIEFGAHTRNHPRLTRVTPAVAREEIEGSMRDLSEALALPIRHFAYPHGDRNDVVERIAEEAGYEGSCSVLSGLNTPGAPLHALHRTEIMGTDTLEMFAAKLRTGSSNALGSKLVPPRAAEVG